ncbi:MAG TPA: D-aminoacyl-tRNA deacylase [Dokdonella sp.]|uniref:D-aminoacyl-tRNA deacylase n=1 Tax=Dokdonella sp. TaxID=2291710 RepID=UPI002D804404|nr:D-aminoacyl-tRNA deacylase [Dokdonella sp.]HET9033409.1 D-aminoacyl-tRNA deacylase [Dokdonella sp.]
MIALLQRVSEASVKVDAETVGRIDAGLLVFVAVERGDGETQLQRMLERILGYRVFSDDAGRMNRSLRDVGGGLLLVSQFTLAADTSSGMRAGFSGAASPEHGELIFSRMVDLARKTHSPVETGRFRTHMRVQLVNDGPVTFHLRVAPET